MPFSMTECFCKWSYSVCSPEAFCFQISASIDCNTKRKHEIKILGQSLYFICKNAFRKNECTETDGMWIIFPHVLTCLSQDCFIYTKAKGHILCNGNKKKWSIKSDNPSCVTTPWGPLSIARRKKGGCCLGMHICSVYGPSASFIIPNWHIFLDLFLLLQRSIQRLFSQWGSKALGFFF